jgi:hypothetical protein
MGATGAKVSERQRVVVREVGGFKLLKELGEGGMGKVFLARQTSLDRLVAIKVLQPELSADREFIERFDREAVAAAAFQHPHVVQVFERGVDATSGVHYIAFEYVDGGSLEDLIKSRGRLEEAEVLPLARGVAAALEFAESKGIIHRDVKPENILISRTNGAKLADLGLAKQQGQTNVTQTGVVLGTPLYMAPEQALGEGDLDVRADLYALGLCVWRALTGLVPFDEDRTGSSLQILSRHIHQDLPDVRARNPGVSEPVAKVIGWLSARDRAQRYPTAAQAVRDLDLILTGRAPAGPQDLASDTTVLAEGSPVRSPGTSSPAVVAPTAPGISAAAPARGLSPPTWPVIAGLLVGALGLGIGLALAIGGRHRHAPPTPPAPPAPVVAPATSSVAPTPATEAAASTTEAAPRGDTFAGALVLTMTALEGVWVDAAPARARWTEARDSLRRLATTPDQRAALARLDGAVSALFAAIDRPGAEARAALARALAAPAARPVAGSDAAIVERGVDHWRTLLDDVGQVEALLGDMTPVARAELLQRLEEARPLAPTTLAARKLIPLVNAVDAAASLTPVERKRLRDAWRERGDAPLTGRGAVGALLREPLLDLQTTVDGLADNDDLPTALTRAALREGGADSTFLQARVDEATPGRPGERAQGLVAVLEAPPGPEGQVVFSLDGTPIHVGRDRVQGPRGDADPLAWPDGPVALVLEVHGRRHALRALDARTGRQVGETMVMWRELVVGDAAELRLDVKDVTLAHAAFLAPQGGAAPVGEGQPAPVRPQRPRPFKRFMERLHNR